MASSISIFKTSAPLNIFEPRYIQMKTNDWYDTTKRSKSKKKNFLNLGKISSFNEKMKIE